MFTVYILHSETRKRYYIGFTGEPIESRLKKHLANHSGFTGKISDWKLVYTENFIEKKKAMDREREIKNWKSSKMIKQLIHSTE